MFPFNSSTRTPARFRFSRRRLRNFLVTMVGLILLWVVVYAQTQTLNHSSFTTGYLLMGAIVFLAAFNLRKKLPFLPGLGSAAFWMQLHIYVGLATFGMFGFHIAWHVPSGKLETMLALLYLTVALSGVYGLFVTRYYPARLRSLGTETIFENIPILRQKIAVQARQVVLATCETSDVLAKFYANRLAHFFERSRSLVYLIQPNGRLRRQLISEMEDLDRYLADDQRAVRHQLSTMVQQRDDLDYHYAVQGRLKTWMFVHIGLTYSLLAVALVHMVLVHSFSGGLP